MDDAVTQDDADYARALLRRRFLKGIGGALLTVGAGVLTVGCQSTSSTGNAELGDWDNEEHGGNTGWRYGEPGGAQPGSDGSSGEGGGAEPGGDGGSEGGGGAGP